MRKSVLIAAVVCVVAVNAVIALGCTGGLMGSEPEHPREYYRSSLGDPPEAFENMDLPYHGGKVEKSTDGFMEVSYRDELTVDQIVALWPAALEAEGWVQTEGRRTSDQGYSGRYDTPDGGSGALAVKPTGSLWTVLLTKRPPSN